MLALKHKVLLSRKDLGLTQKELAERAGVSRSHVASIETGQVTNIGLDVGHSLAEALGVSPAYLLGLTDDPLKGVDDDEDEPLNLRESSPPYITDPTTKELLDLLHELEPEQRRRFIDGAKLLLGVPRIIE